MAEEICVSVLSETITSLIKKSALQARYMFCFNDIVETFEKKKQELIITQKSIEDRAKIAREAAETIDAQVKKWLDDAENLMKEVDELQKKINLHNAAGWCPNYIRRYCVGKRVTKKTEALTHLKDNCNFREFSRVSALLGMEYYSTEGFIPFESRNGAYDQIIEALQDDKIHRIGVHGMGGCGKTTLVKKVGKEAEQQKLFEKVFIVVVSNSPDIRKIQSSIAGSLGLKFELEQNESERARRLSMAFNNRGKILLILDDVWKRLDFEVIGIPNKCYILLTTRESLICTDMECQKVISLSVLNKTESWILLQKYAGISDDRFDTFKNVGQEILDKCKGLPIAIAVVGSYLKNKGLAYWEVARDKLKDFAQEDIDPALEDIYKCLKLSYDNIRREGEKWLLLLCSLFLEDFEIPMEDLTRYSMGLGLFGRILPNESTRNQVSVAIDNLIDSCLLLKGDSKNTIKMHDLVHDLAWHIGKAENKMIMGIERSKVELEEHSILNDSEIRYLSLDMDKFPRKLNCPKLEFLAINTHFEDQVEVTDEFISGLKELRVLVLRNDYYKRITLLQFKTIHSLTNLRCLIIDGWLLDDISFICNLVKIESLQLWSCSFHELPDGVVNLKNLRLLDMLACEIKRNPWEVIGRCSQLEELYFVENECLEWGDNGENIVEILSSKLQRYHIEIGPNFRYFDHEGYSIKRYLSLKDLDSYSSIGTIDALIRRAEVLYLGGIHRGCKSIIPAFMQKIGEGMTELTQLFVHESDEVECVVDLTNSTYQIGTVFSNLIYLKISRMQKLENLFLGQSHQGIFQKLEKLHISKCRHLKHMISEDNNLIDYNSVFPELNQIVIHDCKELEYLMPVSFTRGLLKLEYLEIRGASQLKYVFGHTNIEDEHLLCNLKSLKLSRMPNMINICPGNYYPLWPSLNSLELEDCPQLKFMHDDIEFRQRDHTFTKNEIVFRNLTKLQFDRLHSLETLFVGTPQLVGFEKLEEISILNCSQLKHLIASDAEKINSNNSIFPKLKVIDIRGCNHLEYLMPVSLAKGLLQLESVKICYALKLKHVFGPSNQEAAEDVSFIQNMNEPPIIKLQALKYLSLERLPSIVSICPEYYDLIWPSLESLTLEYCPQLNINPTKNCIVGLELRQQQHHNITKELVAATVSYLQNLKTLFVSENNKMDAIFHIQELRQDGQQVIVGLTVLVLEGLSELKYIWIGQEHPPIFRNLKRLTIGNCEKLEVVFSTSIVRSLNNLERLEITECQGLQQIFQVDEETVDLSNLSSGHVCLPNLTTLCVMGCNKLKCLFPSMTSIELPKLKILIIKEVSELEEVIACENYDKKEHVQVKFPELEHVILVKLPKLHEVYQGIEWGTVTHRIVHHCPKLSLKSSDTLENLEKMYKKFHLEANYYIEWLKIKDIISEVQAESETELHLAEVDTYPEMQGSKTQNDNCAKSEVFTTEQKVSPIVSSKLTEGNKEKGQESNQENFESKETMIAPLSTHLEPQVTSTHADSISSTLPGQTQATNTSFNWQMEKEDNCEGLGNDSKNKHHQESFDSLSEAQSTELQREDKSCNWGHFLTLSLFSGPHMVEESISDKTTYHHILPERIHSEAGIVEENPNTCMQKSQVSPKSNVKSSSNEDQKARTSGTLLISEKQAFEHNTELPHSIGVTSKPFNVSASKASPSNQLHEFTTSSQLSFTANAEGDILGGFDLNKLAKESFEAIRHNSSPRSLVVLQNLSLQRIDGSVEEVPTLGDPLILTSTPSKPTSSVQSQSQGQIKFNQTETYVGEDVKEYLTNPEKLKDVDLVSSHQSMIEYGKTQAPEPSFSKTTAKNLMMEDNLVAMALTDIQISLKVPLKDIASIEYARLRLENALNFLSYHFSRDGPVSCELKAAIGSLHQDFPSILSSFKLASTTIDRFTVLEEKEKSMQEELHQQGHSVVTLMANIFKTEISMAEIQQKKANLMDKISRLKVELNNAESRMMEYEAELSSLQQQKNKCVVESIEFKKEFERVKERKTQMIEDHNNAQQELFKVNNKWLILCSQFEQSHLTTKNLS